MSRRVALLAVAFATFALAGCGGSDDAAAPSTAASTSVASSVATTPASTAPLTVAPTTHAPTTASTVPTTHVPTSALAPTTASTVPTSTPTTSASSTAPPGNSPQGFATLGITIRAAGGAANSFCVWLADTEARRERGLMQVTSLGGKSGMIFSYPADTNEQFWMYQTVMPLSIAFFDSSGAFVSAADMSPCPGAPSTCPVYPAAGPYRDAIEVPQGGLGALGIGPGSALVDRGSCPA